MNFLRQATAGQVRAIGPFLDDTDFKTPETALTIANTDIKLVANGGASVNKNSGGGTHRVNGMYGVTFDATDTATVGELEVSCLMTGALIVFKTFFILEEAVFDLYYAAASTGYPSAGYPIQSSLKRGTSFTVEVVMQDTTGAPLTGSTVTIYYFNGSAWVSLGTGTETGFGHYQIASGATAAALACIPIRAVGSGGSGTPVDYAGVYYTDP